MKRLATLTLVLALLGAAAAHTAAAESGQVWSDLSRTSADARCTPGTWLNPVTDSWQMTATHINSYNLDYAPGVGYVKFAVWDLQRRRWADWDTNWSLIPSLSYLGLQYLHLSWRYGAGAFAVYAAFFHNGAWTDFNAHQVGYMNWKYASDGRLLCFSFPG